MNSSNTSSKYGFASNELEPKLGKGGLGFSYLNFDFCSCSLAKCRQCQELDGIRKHRGLDFILHWRNMNKISTRFNLKTYKLEFVNLMT